jgi:hypothetical protein
VSYSRSGSCFRTVIVGAIVALGLVFESNDQAVAKADNQSKAGQLLIGTIHCQPKHEVAIEKDIRKRIRCLSLDVAWDAGNRQTDN